MGKVCNRCGNVVADNMMFCNKCGCMLGSTSSMGNNSGLSQKNDSQLNNVEKLLQQLTHLIKVRRKQVLLISCVCLVLVLYFVFFSTPKVVGVWESNTWGEEGIIVITKDTITVGDDGTYPIKIKGDEIIIDLSINGKGQQVWKYELQGDYVTFIMQGYSSSGEFMTETMQAVRID